MKVADYIKEIEQLIANGDTESACEGLLHILQDKNEDLRSQALLLSGQYREIQRNKILNIENDKQGMNRLNNALLQMCNDVKSELGNDQISDIDLKKLQTIEDENQVKMPVPATSTPVNWGLWLKIGAFALVVLLLYRAYSCVSKTIKSVKQEFATATTVDNSDARFNHASQNTASTPNDNASGMALPTVQPIFLDVKAKMQGFELLETRYYPAAGQSRLVFFGRWHCENLNGCNFSNSQFELIADGKLVETTYDNIQDQRRNEYGSFLVEGLSHILVEIAYDIPANTQKLDWKIKIDGEATIPVDVRKTIAAPPVLPKLVNLTDEKDLNIAQNFSKDYQLLSVKAVPLNDNYFKVLAKIAKCAENCDFYDLCIRIALDDGKTLVAFESLKTKELVSNKQQVVKQVEFILPRTVHAPELIIGNCRNGNTPFKVVLPL